MRPDADVPAGTDEVELCKERVDISALPIMASHDSRASTISEYRSSDYLVILPRYAETSV